ncbi:DUF2188 domain-containing protein [Seonamhaeicola aphaedonensis]|uniref:Uncharacterized protein DUF2188 n=1 Tax=Seonamhaeicola aphaedonensis TaxID=1461338 RepID=A0A3D9HIK1_9FLAO|nr:DUF2188 domain-containing protein [Seonamhaeicola aphaedonensis]RED49264.1 uncharacterized protein DUF2188 [Seonamhaeicola aphaedonensis]
MSKQNTTLDIIKEFVESILKALGYRGEARKRTWHQHVVPYEDGWAVRREGNKRITSKHRKQSTAINKAKTLAKRYDADVIIHRASGEIRERISYKED